MQYSLHSWVAAKETRVRLTLAQFEKAGRHFMEELPTSETLISPAGAQKKEPVGVRIQINCCSACVLCTPMYKH